MDTNTKRDLTHWGEYIRLEDQLTIANIGGSTVDSLMAGTPAPPCLLNPLLQGGRLNPPPDLTERMWRVGGYSAAKHAQVSSAIKRLAVRHRQLLTIEFKSSKAGSNRVINMYGKDNPKVIKMYGKYNPTNRATYQRELHDAIMAFEGLVKGLVNS